MSGGGNRLIPLLFLPALLGCAAQRVNVVPLCSAASSYSAAIQLTATAGGRGMTASGVCAVDPARGGRIELRDPSGATRLLLLFDSRRASLMDVSRGLVYSWQAASAGMPWSAADLWFMFAGGAPPKLKAARSTGEGPDRATWSNAMGTLRCQFLPSPDSPLGYWNARCEGPGRARLDVSWHAFQRMPIPAEAFQPPPGLAFTAASAKDLLEGASP